MKSELVHERCLDRRKFIAGAAGVSVAVVAAALTSCAPEHDATEGDSHLSEDLVGSQAYELVNIDA